MRKFEIVKDKFRKYPNVNIQLPKRGTKYAAAYDFYTPVDIVVPAHGTSGIIPMDIKAYMNQDEVLLLFVRSSIGIKRGLVLSNGTGVIDFDYCDNETNDGNIGICLTNTTDQEVIIAAGERVMQGMFVKYLTVDDEQVEQLATRTGGYGSTNK